MGTKKGQRRKTARRAYRPGDPSPKQRARRRRPRTPLTFDPTDSRDYRRAIRKALFPPQRRIPLIRGIRRRK